MSIKLKQVKNLNILLTDLVNIDKLSQLPLLTNSVLFSELSAKTYIDSVIESDIVSLSYKGMIDISNNFFNVISGITGDFYIIEVDCNIDDIQYYEGDILLVNTTATIIVNNIQIIKLFEFLNIIKYDEIVDIELLNNDITLPSSSSIKSYIVDSLVTAKMDSYTDVVQINIPTGFYPKFYQYTINLEYELLNNTIVKVFVNDLILNSNQYVYVADSIILNLNYHLDEFDSIKLIYKTKSL